jgi:cyanophycin synthetase
MSQSRHALHPRPKWSALLGYAYGLPQSCMIAVAPFPADLAARKVNADFAQIIADVVETPQRDLPAAMMTAHVLADAALRVQNWAGIPVATEYALRMLGQTKDGQDTVQMTLPFWRLEASKTAYAICADVWNRLAAGQSIADAAVLRADWTAKLSGFVSTSVNEFVQVKATMALGINLRVLTNGILCLGTGARARLMQSTTSDRTPGFGLAMARNKQQTARLLQMAGLPAAVNKRVTSADEAVKAAQDFGGAVVVKPADQDRGDGVAADLHTAAQIRDAFIKARAFSENILVEKMIAGFTHRFTVVAGDVVSVRQRVPGGVTGNGRDSIADLVQAHQQTDRSRRWARRRGRSPVDLDTEALELLAEHTLTAQTVLADGQFQRLRRRDNLSAGGHNIELPLDAANVHPDNIQIAIAAAQMLRLDIAGIDLISSDIAQSWRDVGAAICEVNGCPQFNSYDKPEMFQKVVLRMTGPNPHVPAQLIICADNPSERAAVVAKRTAKTPSATIATREGLWRGGQNVTGAFKDGFAAAVAAITRIDTAALICVMSPQDMCNTGSPIRVWNNIYMRQAGMTQKEQAMLPVVQSILGMTPDQSGASARPTLTKER